MGTSINSSSPDTTVWNVVAACYDKDIPLDRTSIYLWRAITANNAPLVAQLTSDLAVSYVLGRPGHPGERGRPHNSIAAELVRRGVQITRARGPDQSMLGSVFRQLTDYFVARDIAGHVGPTHRCKTFGEVTLFKRNLGSLIEAKVARIAQKHRLTPERWSESVHIILKSLASP